MTTQNMTLEQQIAALKAENEALKAGHKALVTLKISDKGCISMYGLGSRFPVTLYRKQWNILLSRVEEIKAFLEANKTQLDKVDSDFAQDKAARKVVNQDAA